ncbi:MAG: beta-ketoacyl synthase chain length factor [Gammaproteobacteria bacterium]|nr:beta-ketoacyl synthase chain length factor [Gammaproteobacteria bacterium]MBU6508786.1 beta-ketoacyl synthase chain length factor [Gammaproteobacteria bacterium]MDE2109202.1 beta-ketoacyl synthase chain length factor [Gammaproteobacteria bacterium]
MQQTGDQIGGFGIRRWRAWAPGVETGSDWEAWLAGAPAAASPVQPDVSQLPAMLRRRLDPLGRMALHTAWSCLDGVAAAQFVFASRHGSLPRTVELLAALARQQPLSPTLFSVSVHNGTAGLYSMARGDRSAATAVAAGADTLGMGLLEAACQVNTGAAHVLFCYADESLPEPYTHAPGNAGNCAAFSIAMLLEPVAPASDVYRLLPAASAASEAPVKALLRFLIEHRANADLGVEQRWRLQRSPGAG